MAKFCVVGSGFTGAIVARALAQQGFKVDIFEVREHIAGNCYTYRDSSTGIIIHKYGPHIFHTDSNRAWEYIRHFSEFRQYTNRVKAVAKGSVYSLPINLHTINQVFGKSLSPAEAQLFLLTKADTSIKEPQNFKEQALRLIGQELYELFFEGYTRKQWEIDPTELPSSILKRLPIRFNYNDSYFSHSVQVMPVDGYTPIVERIIDCAGINLYLKTGFEQCKRNNYEHVFFTGPLDAWFDHSLGRLPYRTLDFESSMSTGDFQGNAVINYCDYDIPFTRITEHKHFAPWESHNDTVYFKEYSRSCGELDEPYYPVRFAGRNRLLAQYVELAKKEVGVSFMGRLGTFKYMDMDVTILSALEATDKILESLRIGSKIPAFFSEH